VLYTPLSQEKLTVIAGTVSPSAYRPCQHDYDKIAGYRIYQKRYRLSRKWTQHSGLYTGGLTDPVLFPIYSRFINRLPGSPSRFLPSSYNRFPFSTRAMQPLRYPWTHSRFPTLPTCLATFTKETNISTNKHINKK